MGDDFSNDAAQYAELAGEIYSNPGSELDQIMGGALEPPPLDQREVDAAVAQQNQQHARSVQQGPVQQEALEWLQEQNQRLPSAEEDPISHFGQRMANMEQVTQAFGTMQAGQQFWDQVDRSEKDAREQISDYDAACEHVTNGRYAELCQMYPDARLKQAGFNNPAEKRLAMLNQEKIAVASHALRTNQNPAKLFYDIAVQRGYQSNRHISPRESKQLAAMHDRWSDTGDERAGQTFDQWWDQAAAKGLL